MLSCSMPIADRTTPIRETIRIPPYAGRLCDGWYGLPVRRSRRCQIMSSQLAASGNGVTLSAKGCTAYLCQDWPLATGNMGLPGMSDA